MNCLPIETHQRELRADSRSEKIYFEKYTDTKAENLTTDDYLFWNGYEDLTYSGFKSDLLKYFKGGFNYIISGVGFFKVGRTTEPQKRRDVLIKEFKKARLEIVGEYWTAFHGSFEKNEKILTEFCRINGYEAWSGKEYFKGDSSDVIRFAETLDCPPPNLIKIEKYNPFFWFSGCHGCGFEKSKYLHCMSDRDAAIHFAKKYSENKNISPCGCEKSYYENALLRFFLTNKRAEVESLYKTIHELQLVGGGV